MPVRQKDSKMKNQTNITSKSPMQSPIHLMRGAFTTYSIISITDKIKDNYTKQRSYSMLIHTYK